jgi:sulfate transport system permease protein
LIRSISRAEAAPRRIFPRRTLPGFGLSLGFALFYLSLLVLIPLAGLFLKTASLTWSEIFAVIGSPRALAAYRLTFGASLATALLNGVIGTLVAWVLVRYRFPGRRLLDSLVDFPLALPTAVAGLTFSSLYAEKGWLGQFLAPFGIKVSYTPLGVIVVLTFVTLPFVVRALQPVLKGLEAEIEEAAASLGADRRQTFARVIGPTLLPAWLTGVALAFARAVGEYGSVIFIAGNLPLRTEIAPLLIVIQLEQFNYANATAIALVLLLSSFVLVVLINLLGRWSQRYA